jgi:hypothetical protein
MAWHTGDSRPLAVRYAECAAELARLGEAPLYPQTEANLYEMVQIVSRKRPVVVDDPALAVAGRLHFDLRHRYMRCVLEIEKLQSRLTGVVGYWVHRLLNDVPSNWNANLRRQLPDTDTSATAIEVRQDVGRITPIVLATEALRDQLVEALGVTDREPALLHFQLLEALFKRVEQLERGAMANDNALSERVDELETIIGRIGKRVRSRRKVEDVK